MSALIFAFILFAPAAYAQEGQGTCASIKPFKTEIKVNFMAADPVYDLTKKARDIAIGMNQFLPRWLRDNDLEAAWQANELEFGGLALGGWGMISDFKVQSASVDKYGVYYCPYVQEVNVDIIYRSLMLIDSNIRVNSCEFNMVNRHMTLHHDTGKAVIDNYAGKMKKDLSQIANEMEAKAGYVGGKEINDNLDAMKSGLEELVRVYYKQAIVKDFLKYSNALDTPEMLTALRTEAERCKLGMNEKTAADPAVAPVPEVQKPGLKLNIE